MAERKQAPLSAWPPAAVGRRGYSSITRRKAVASGVPRSEKSERCRQLRRQDVLDHDPGAPVTFGGECPDSACHLGALRSQSTSNSVSSAAARRVTGSRGSQAAARSRGSATLPRRAGSGRNCCLERGMVEPSVKRGQSSWWLPHALLRRAPLLRHGRRFVADLRGFAGRGQLALRKLLGAQPGRLAVIGTRFVVSGGGAGAPAR